MGSMTFFSCTTDDSELVDDTKIETINVLSVDGLQQIPDEDDPDNENQQ